MINKEVRKKEKRKKRNIEKNEIGKRHYNHGICKTVIIITDVYFSYHINLRKILIYVSNCLYPDDTYLKFNNGNTRTMC